MNREVILASIGTVRLSVSVLMFAWAWRLHRGKVRAHKRMVMPRSARASLLIGSYIALLGIGEWPAAWTGHNWWGTVVLYLVLPVLFGINVFEKDLPEVEQ